MLKLSAIRRAHHGEADAGVSARRFDDGHARFELARPFRVLDHAEGEAVLHGAEWVEGLDFDEEVDARGSELVDLDDRRLADGLEDVGESCHGGRRIWTPMMHSRRRAR
jgi:hypothetical protein